MKKTYRTALVQIILLESDIVTASNVAGEDNLGEIPNDWFEGGIMQ